jgi:uncharacterized protein
LPLTLKFRVLPQGLAVCRLPRAAHVPSWALQDEFFSLTRTADELSIVCEEARVPDGVKAERNWVALKLEGPFPFSMTGVLASFIEPLAKHKIPIFALATFDTDYVLIKRENLEAALRALAEAGHEMLD